MFTVRRLEAEGSPFTFISESIIIVFNLRAKDPEDHRRHRAGLPDVLPRHLGVANPALPIDPIAILTTLNSDRPAAIIRKNHIRCPQIPIFYDTPTGSYLFGHLGLQLTCPIIVPDSILLVAIPEGNGKKLVHGSSPEKPLDCLSHRSNLGINIRRS